MIIWLASKCYCLAWLICFTPKHNQVVEDTNHQRSQWNFDNEQPDQPVCLCSHFTVDHPSFKFIVLIDQGVHDRKPNWWEHWHDDCQAVSMRQLGWIFKRVQSLIRFKRVFVMVWVSLQLEQQIIWDSVRGVPGMFYCYFLVLSILQFLSSESIVFNVVDDFKVGDSTHGCYHEKNESLTAIDSPNKPCENESRHYT
jgi:hypothetical protein